MSFLKSGVAGKVDGFHTVKKRRRNCVETVRCGNKQNLAQIYWNIDIVIGEGVILLRVEDLEHCCRRVTVEVRCTTTDISF